jgi:fatty acid desaturase
MIQAPRLMDPRESHELHQLSWRRLLPALLYVPAWIAGGTLCVLAARSGWSPWLWIPLWTAGWAVAGLSLAAFFLLMHEGTHGTLAKSSRLNRLLAVIFGIPAFLGFTSYRVLHLRHHENLGGGDDPDDYANYTSNVMVLWTLHLLRLTIGSYLYLVLIPILAWRHGSRSDRIAIAQESLLLGAIYMVVFWWLPGSIAFQALLLPTLPANLLTNARGLAQHGMANTRDPFTASRSIRPAAWVRHLFLNENYHLEHHLYPGVPHYRLHDLHLVLSSRWTHALWIPGYLWFLRRFFAALCSGDDANIGYLETNPTQTLPWASRAPGGASQAK